MSCGGGWIVLEWFCVRRGKTMFGKKKKEDYFNMKYSKIKNMT